MKAKRSRLLMACAVLLLASAAVLWWDLFRDGATLRGAAEPALVTLMGVFWLLVASRTRWSSRDRDLSEP